MAKALRISVNAEGIETNDQAAIVRRLGCDQGQGFLYGRAEPLDVLTERLAPSRGSPVLLSA